MVNALNYLTSKFTKFNHNLLSNNCTKLKNFKNVLDFDTYLSFILYSYLYNVYQLEAFANAILNRQVLEFIFTEIFSDDSKFMKLSHCVSVISTLCSTELNNEKFSLTHFWQNFREINGFTKSVTKEAI